MHAQPLIDRPAPKPSTSHHSSRPSKNKIHRLRCGPRPIEMEEVLQTDLRSYADLGLELYARWLERRSNVAGFMLVVCLP